MRIEGFSPENLEKIVVLAQRLNARRENGSAFCCSEADSIRRDFEENMAASFGCWEEDTPVGLLSCYPDWEKGNADCAMLIDPDGVSYEAAAQALLTAVRKTLGAEMACTFFFPKENHDCAAFLEETGAKRQVSEYSMLLKKDHWRTPPVAPVPQPLRPEQARDFARLHDAVFPGVYCSGQDILETWGKNRFLYVLERQQELVAYGVLRSSGRKQATAEIVGVRNGFRGHGYGRAILNYLAETAFTQFGAEELDLIVDSNNQRAIDLYLSVGFTIVQENCCYILK